MNGKKMKIGVFDSGVGGQYVANFIAKEFPDAEILLKEDKENLPYGTKTKSELLKLVLPIIKSMVDDGCDVIVIACNTVTTNIITELREVVETPLIGIEPMVKPAANHTQTKTITICATPATLRSERYAWLKKEYAKNIKVIEPDCSNWAEMIEDNQVNEQEITTIIQESLDNNSDVIVLGCTHYHWIYELIKQRSGDKVAVLQPTDAVIKQLRRVIKQLR